MKSKKLFIAVAALLISSSVLAQTTYEASDGTKYEFKKYWFMNLEGGLQYTLGEAEFRRLLRPNVQVGLGFQFSPVIGARIQANGWQSRGGWNGYGNPGYTRAYGYKYIAPGIDLMFNISNLLCGWNPKRFFNVTAFIGGGANIGFDNDEVNNILSEMKVKGMNPASYELEYAWSGTQIRPFGRGGLEAAFRLSDAVALTIEGNANLLSDKYNSKKADNPDWYFNALVGLKINLGKTYNKILPPPPAPEPEPQPVVEPEPAPAPAPAPVVIEPIRRDVFFLINKTEIRAEEAQKVKDIADYMQKYPKSKVIVTGYADAGTGNDKINDRLAAGRADAVVNSLINDYGIAQDRITYDSKGSRVQPFAENDMNRVTICIAE